MLGDLGISVVVLAVGGDVECRAMEYADGDTGHYGRSASPFPARWGMPPADEDMRVRWALSHIKQDTVTAPVRAANRRRVEELEARREAPTLSGWQAQRMLLELRRCVLADATAMYAAGDHWYRDQAVQLLIEAGADPQAIDLHVKRRHAERGHGFDLARFANGANNAGRASR
jgi:hypothetical protein